MGYKQGGKGYNPYQGNGKGKHWQPKQGGYGNWGGSPFVSLANQWNSCMENVQAMAQMSQIGSFLSGAMAPSHAAPAAAPSSVPALGQQHAPAGSALASGATEAHDLVRAVTRILDEKSDPGDSRAAQTAQRLASLVKKPGDDDVGELEHNPAFIKLKKSVASLEETSQQHTKQLDHVQNTTAAAAADSKATRDMMEQFMKNVGQQAPRWGGGKGGGPAMEIPSAFFKDQVDAEMHEAACNLLGISPTRAQMQTLGETIQGSPEGTVGFADWWSEVQKMKALSQRKTKLNSMEAPEAKIEDLTMKKVGLFLYAHLLNDGSFSEDAKQTIALD